MDVLMPGLDANEDNAKVTRIYINDCEYVEKGTTIIDVENTKTVYEIAAPTDGFIKLLCNEFETFRTGDKLAIIFNSEEKLKLYSEESSLVLVEEKKINATKKAIELAKIHKVDLFKLQESKDGKVIKTEDVEQLVSEKKPSFLSSRINLYDRERVVLIGAGMGAEIVIDILMDDKDKYVVGLVDTYIKEFSSYSYPLLNCIADDFPEKIDKGYYDTVLITIGSSLKTMSIRKALFDSYKEKGIRFTNAVADNVSIRRATCFGTGNIIPHNCYFGTGTSIGDNNSFSYGVLVGHHCSIGSNNLFAPGVAIAGCVSIGDSCILATNVCTRNQVKIGSNVALPLGYCVNVDIPNNTIVRNS